MRGVVQLQGAAAVPGGSTNGILFVLACFVTANLGSLQPPGRYPIGVVSEFAWGGGGRLHAEQALPLAVKTAPTGTAALKPTRR